MNVFVAHKYPITIPLLVTFISTLEGSIQAGRTALADGDLLAAHAALESAVASQPDSVEANVLLGLVKLSLVGVNDEVDDFFWKWGFRINSSSLTDIERITLRYEQSDESKWSYFPEGGFDGGDAIASGRSVSYWQSTVKASFVGPGELSYFWRLEDFAQPRGSAVATDVWGPELAEGFASSGEPWENSDYFQSIEANTEATITSFFGPGRHTVSWSFYDPSDSAISGARLFLDQIQFTPSTGALPPTLGAPGSIEDGADSNLVLVNDGFTDKPVFDNPSLSDTFGFFRKTLADELRAAAACLAVYGDSGPTYIPLPSTELPWDWAGDPTEFRIDLADCLYLRSLIMGCVSMVELSTSFDLGDIDFQSGYLAAYQNAFSAEELLSDHPALLARLDAFDGSALTNLIDEALAMHRSAIQLIAERPIEGAQQHLIAAQNLAPGDDDHGLIDPGDLNPTPDAVVDYLDSWIAPDQSIANVENSFTDDEGKEITVSLAPLFDPGWDLRAHLPFFGHNSIRLGGFPNAQSLSDPTIGSLVTGLSDKDWTDILEEAGGSWRYQDFQPFALKHNLDSSLTNYVFPEPPIYRVPEYTWETTYFVELEIRPSLNDITLEYQRSRDIKNWLPSEAISSSQMGYYLTQNRALLYLVAQSYSRFDRDLSEPLFARFKTDFWAWPADWTNWTVKGGQYYDRGPRLSILSNKRLEWWIEDDDGSNPILIGTYDLKVIESGNEVVFLAMEEGQVHHSMKLIRYISGEIEFIAQSVWDLSALEPTTGLLALQLYHDQNWSYGYNDDWWMISYEEYDLYLDTTTKTIAPRWR